MHKCNSQFLLFLPNLIDNIAYQIEALEQQNVSYKVL